MPNFSHSYALVIGIDAYQNGITPLNNAVNDARDVANLLESKHGYQVWRLFDQTASCEVIQHHLKTELPQQIQSNDRLLFYFSGHGIQLNSPEGPEGYLIPQTAKLGQSGTYLSMNEVYQDLSALPCRHLLGILDCCFAGSFRWAGQHRKITVVDSETLYRETFDRFICDPAWQVITSAAFDQLAYDAFDLKNDRGQAKSRPQNSPFAATLLEALEGGADSSPPSKEPGQKPGDGVITATELYQYVRDVIEPATESCGMRQTPGLYPLGKHDKGEYIFLTPDHSLNLPPAPLLDLSTNPYQGLASFNEADHDRYFGRKDITKKLYQFFIENQLTVVLGPSGSGKSSLVKAGLLPQLRKIPKDKTLWAILPPFRPGESPFQSLNQVLEKLNLPDVTLGSALQKSHKDQAQSLEASLENWFQENQVPLIVVIDQFEELITRCGDEERQQFLQILATALQHYPQKLHLLITLRSDFESQFQESPLNHFWQRSRFQVSPLTRQELQQVIEEPAALRVLFFDPSELVDRLIDEVINMPGGLPLLSFALSELYLIYLERQETARNQGQSIERAITYEDYEALGGVTLALIQRAEEEYERLVQEDLAYTQTVEQVMLRMVALGVGDLARRPFLESEQKFLEPEQGRVQTVINRFLEARLLVSGKTNDGESFVEPAHDALVQGWPRLSKWLKQENVQETVLLIRSLTPIANQWMSSERGKRAQGLLWKDNPRLPQALQVMCGTSYGETWHNFFKWVWQGKIKTLRLRKKGFWESLLCNVWFNANEEQFIKDSLDHRYRDRLSGYGITGLVIAAIISFGGIAGFQRNQAIQNQINTLITLSEGYSFRNDQLGALLFSVQAGSLMKHSVFIWIDRNTRSRTVTSLRDSLYRIQELGRMEEHSDKVSSVKFSPDGQMIASASEDGSVKLWNIDSLDSSNVTYTGFTSLEFEGSKKRLTSVDFSPNSQFVVAGGEDGLIRLWKSNGTLIKDFHKYQSQDSELQKIASVSFSPDGNLIASGREDENGTIQIRQLNGDLVREFRQQAKVTTVCFSPDGQNILVGSQDGSVKLWSLSGNLIRKLDGHTEQITSADFSPSGQTVVSSSKDKTVRFWQLDGTSNNNLTFDVKNYITSIKFSPNGQTVATADVNSTIKTWDLDWNELQIIEGHHEQVTSISFSPDGKKLASGSWDSTVRLWDLKHSNYKTLHGQNVDGVSPDLEKKPGIWGVGFSPDGNWLVTASEDKRVNLWTSHGEFVKTLGQHGYWATSLDISPDSQRVVSGGATDRQNILLLGINNKNVLSNENRFQGHFDAVWSVKFSPDGKTIASSGEDKNINLWRLDGTLLHTLSGHKESVWGINFSPNGQVLASASDDDTVRLWQTDGTFLKTLEGHTGTVSTVEFSPNGELIASGSDDLTIRLWKSDGTFLKKIIGHTGAITSLSFSPDGQVIASGSEDKTIRLWRVSDGHLIQTLQGHRDRVWSVDFHPGGNLLATGGDDQTAILWNFNDFDWDVENEVLLDRGCTWINNYLHTSKKLTDEQKGLCKKP